MTKKWAVLIPYSFEPGHGYVYQEALRRCLLELGCTYEGHTLRGSALVQVGFWATLSKTKGWRIFDFIKLFSKGDQTTFFLETIPLLDLIALVGASLFLRKKAQLALLFRFPLRRRKALLALLRKIVGPRLLIFSDSERIAKTIGATLLPILHTEGLKGSVQAAQDPVTLWWPGPPREEKGLHILKKLPKTEKIYANLKYPGICYLPELTREDYVQQMMKSDIILLPYDPTAYYARTSGVFVEAVFAGKVPVVLEGSWLANELRLHDLEELIVDFSSLDAIIALAKNEAVLKKLAKMQAHYRNYHCLENFKKILAKHTVADQGSSKGHKDRQRAHPHPV